MKRAALGFRVHSGWAALVAITLEEGCPQVLLRDRPLLVKTFTFEFRQPYHTAKKKPLAAARDFIAQMRAEAGDLASRLVHLAHSGLRERGYELGRCGLLLASGRPLPELPQILASHALIHTADGELFREALLDACQKESLDTFTVKESELLERACGALRWHTDEIMSRLADAGRPHGSPWAQDEKLAALAAWLSLL